MKKIKWDGTRTTGKILTELGIPWEPHYEMGSGKPRTFCQPGDIKIAGIVVEIGDYIYDHGYRPEKDKEG